MSLRLNPQLAAVEAPPIAAAQAWVANRTFPADKPLIDLAQAVPGDPPPEELRHHVADMAFDPEYARYGFVPGDPDLRAAYADDVRIAYGGDIRPDDVLIAAGCNQSFCLAAMAVAQAGDAIALPVPFYFSHRMWLEALGITVVPLPFRADRNGVPDVADLARVMTPNLRAVTLVTPNNPTGTIYPPELVTEFYDFARDRGLALILDETYRDFRPDDRPAHFLFARDDWRNTLIHLYSFSKVFCLTGYRTGTLVAGPGVIASAAKAMDCVAVCAPRLGQRAALYGLQHLGEWRRRNAQALVTRVAALTRHFQRNDIGFQLINAGAYFAYVRHPFAGVPAVQVAKRLADEANILCLAGSAFGPDQDDYLRLAFANVSDAELMQALDRLSETRSWRF